MQITRTEKEFEIKDFEVKYLGEYHNLHVQRYTLLLAEVFENFQNMCVEIYEPGPARFFTAPGLPWQTTFKKTKSKIRFFNRC